MQPTDRDAELPGVWLVGSRAADTILLHVLKGDELAAVLEIELTPAGFRHRSVELGGSTVEAGEPAAAERAAVLRRITARLPEARGPAEASIVDVVRLCGEGDAQPLRVPPWGGFIANDDNNWVEGPGDPDAPLVLPDCTQRVLRDPIAEGQSQVRFVLPPGVPPAAAFDLFAGAYLEAMAIATARLIAKLVRILTQSRCPNAQCVLVWQSTPIYYLDNTPPPLVVPIPQGWPGGGGKIVVINPRVDARIDVILDCSYV